MDSIVPKAGKTLTPTQYGVTAPPGDRWPLNAHDPTQYALNRYYPTIQGEGKQVGTPMTIVRLQGCPVGCVWCDTPETWTPPDPQYGNQMVGPGEWRGWWYAVTIAVEVGKLPPRWALVTGGEPTWHDLGALTTQLREKGIKKSLETSGVYPITGKWDWVCISPKPAGRLALKAENLYWADEIKWIVGKQTDVEALERFLDLHKFYFPDSMYVSLQPVSCGKKATEVCLEALMKHPEWRLSLQVHKSVLNIA